MTRVEILEKINKKELQFSQLKIIGNAQKSHLLYEKFNDLFDDFEDFI